MVDSSNMLPIDDGIITSLKNMHTRAFVPLMPAV